MGKYGRLGHGDEKNQQAPTLVSSLLPHKVTAVSLGERHSAAVTGDHHLSSSSSSSSSEPSSVHKKMESCIHGVMPALEYWAMGKCSREKAKCSLCHALLSTWAVC